MKNSFCSLLGMVAWTINTIVLLDFGLGAIGYGFLHNISFIQQNFQMVQYVILFTAIWNLYLYIRHFQGEKGCTEKQCRF